MRNTLCDKVQYDCCLTYKNVNCHLILYQLGIRLHFYIYFLLQIITNNSNDIFGFSLAKSGLRERTSYLPAPSKPDLTAPVHFKIFYFALLILFAKQADPSIPLLKDFFFIVTSVQYWYFIHITRMINN